MGHALWQTGPSGSGQMLLASRSCQSWCRSRTQLISTMASTCWGILHPLIYPILLFILVLVNLAGLLFLLFKTLSRAGVMVLWLLL